MRWKRTDHGENMLFNRYNTSKVYGNGQIILPQGSRLPVMGLIEAGRVEVFHKSEDGDETIFQVLEPNQSFGVDSLFNKRPRRTGVRAVGKATVAIMDKRDFIRRTQIDPQLAFNVLRSVFRRILEIDEISQQKDIDSTPDKDSDC